jgi:hypothetical protein
LPALLNLAGSGYICVDKRIEEALACCTSFYTLNSEFVRFLVFALLHEIGLESNVSMSDGEDGEVERMDR